MTNKRSGASSWILLLISIIFSGWAVGILFFWAQSLIGGGVSVLFLPAGLSGWVIIKISSYLSLSFSNVGIPNSVVPAKIIFCINYIFSSGLPEVFLIIFVVNKIPSK